MGTTEEESSYLQRMMLALFLLALCLLGSLCLGLRYYDPLLVLEALFGFNGSEEHLVIRDLRLPRALLAPVVGAALGTAGVLVQTLTRNRIAAPDTLGLNAGAALAAVVALSVLGMSSLAAISSAAVAGAAAAAAVIYGIAATQGGISPARTVLAGITLTALLVSLTQVILTTQEVALDELMFWLAGSFTDRPLQQLFTNSWLFAGGALVAIFVAPALDPLTADDDTARGLGLPVERVRALAFVAVVALIGGAVAVAGPVAFIGLVVPHLARRVAGSSHIRVIPFAAVSGAIFAILADILARFITFPGEAPVGAVTALLGGPVLLALLKRRLA